MTDFLLTFTVDGTQAIRMMEDIGARATALEARLNALGRGTGRSSAGNVLTNIGLDPKQVEASSRAMASLESKVASLSAARSAGITSGPTALRNEAKASLDLSRALNAQAAAKGEVSLRGAQMAENSRNLAAQANALTAATDQSTDSFARHTRRIFEAIIVYEAFGAAIQGLSAATGLIVDIDRESRRLEAVLSIDPEQGAQFITGLGEIASRTVTPFENLVEEADRASSAFLDVADPVERAADALQLMDDAGKFTTVTQRDLGTEITNLIAIMQQLNIPIEDFDDFLGQIVTAGGNASTVIGGLSDALQIVARSAEEAGTDTDVLLALLSDFIIKTGRTGSEAGNVFKTLFQRLSDPDVAGNVSEITNGLLKMRDELGNIRDPIQILLELNALFEKGVISATQFKDVLGAFAPPLNPAARQDFILINDILGDIGPKVEEIANADVSSLDALVTKINDALGPKFQRLIIDAQRAFVDLFGPTVIAGGQVLIDLLRHLGTILGALPPEVITLVGVLGSLLIAFKVLAFAGRGLMAILGIQGIRGIFAGMAGTLIPAAGGVGALTGAFNLLGLALRRIIPLAIAFAAIEIGSKLLDQAAAIDRLEKAGFSRREAGEAINGTATTQRGVVDTGAGGRSAFGNTSTQPVFNDAQRENVLRLNQALQQFEDAGNSTALTQQAMKDAITDTNGAISTNLVAMDSIIAAGSKVITNNSGVASTFASVREGVGAASTEFEKGKLLAEEYANGLSDITAAEQIQADTTALLTSLTDERAEALLTLNNRLKEGLINQQEHAQGERDIADAMQAASEITATMGDDLRTLIPELGGAAEGNDALAAAVFDLFLNSSDALPVILKNVDAISRLKIEAAGGSGAEAALARETVLASAAAAAASGNMQPLIALTNQLAGAAAAASVAITAWAVAQTRLGSTFAAIREGSGATLTNALSALHNISLAGIDFGGVSGNLAAAINAIRNAVQNSGSSTFGTGIPNVPRSGGSGTTPTPKTRERASVFDIDDLPPRMVSQLIAIATRLRNRIPGETAESRDSRVALVKDARFLQLVRGIDDRLLRLALDRLTDQIEKSNEREERANMRNNLMSNLVVNQGPLGALISQPTAFGVAGSFAAGNGLNFNPAKGNFVINVPVELKGLQPAALQQLIYNIISRAIREGLRL